MHTNIIVHGATFVDEVSRKIKCRRNFKGAACMVTGLIYVALHFHK